MISRMWRLGWLGACFGALACGGGGGGATDATTADSGRDTMGVDAPEVDAPEIDTNFDANIEREPTTDIGDEGQEVWVFMQSHLHTTGFHDCANNPTSPAPPPDGQCYTAEGILGFLQEALANGASDMIITDHNNIDSWFDPAFAPLANIDRTAYATPLRGTEWSSGDGHMTLMWPTEAVASNAEAIERRFIYAAGNQEPIIDQADYAAVIAMVQEAGGIAIINHPELAIHVFPEDSLGADGVEVGIPPNPLDDFTGGFGVQSSKEARDWWQRRLVEGQRLAGTAGADHHHGGGDIPGLEAPTFGIAVNYVRIDPALPRPSSVTEALSDPDGTIQAHSDAIVDAVRRGHVMIVENEEAPRVYVGVDLDGDGRFHDARSGDCILPSRLEGVDQVRMRVRIVGATPGSGDHFNFLAWTHQSDEDETWRTEVDYDDGFMSAAEYEVDPEDPFSIFLNVPIDPAEREFIRFVLERDVLGPFNDTEAVTNPIYLGDWDKECDGSEPLY